jgi:cilia- and flagella-associated protein 44
MSADDKHALTSYVREETVSDLGRETTSLFHNFGSDITRRDNISLIDDDTIVYPVGNTVVFEELSTGNKRYLLGLDDGGVGCVAVHPSKTMFAVGGKGFQPKIYIYSYPVLKIVRVLSGGAERGYSSLSYNVHGTKLASVATAPDYMLTVWDWDKELIELHSKAFGQDVFTVKFSKDDDRRLTTCGAGHIRFWKMASTFTGLKLQGYIGKFGKVELSDVVAIEELPDGKVVSGTETGALLLWEGNFIKCRFVQVGGKKCHEGEVTYINLDREEKALITAAADGYIRWWDASAIDAAEVDTDITMDFELLPIAEYKLIEGTKVHSIVDCGSKGLNRRIVVSDGNGRMQTVTFQLTASNDYNSNEEEEDVNALMAAGNFVGSLSRSVAKLASTSAEELEQFAPESKVLEEFHADTITAICASPYVHVCATASLDGM